MAPQQENTELISRYVALYKSEKELYCQGTSNYINILREAALKSFETLGFPTRKEDRYKYTNFIPLFLDNYATPVTKAKEQINIQDIFRCDVPDINSQMVLILNGNYHGDGLFSSGLPDGVIIGSLAEASMKFPDLVEKHFAKYADFRKHGLIAMNTVFSRDGLFVYLPRGTRLEKPLQVVNVLQDPRDLMVMHRNLIIAEEGAEATILVCDHTLSPSAFLTNSVTEMFLGNNSEVNYYHLQNGHNKSAQAHQLHVQQSSQSRYNLANIILHGGVVRNDFFVTLAGEGAEANLSGLMLGDQQQHLDNYVHIDHASPSCNSHQLFKSILDNGSVGVFNGRIIVSKGAQKTAAYQRSNNLLLTNMAKMYTKPQLEIYADDVKCSHGATIGQIDEDALFYLRSRGIAEKEARFLLMSAFTDEVIRLLKLPALREKIAGLVDKRLRGELSKCNVCGVRCY